MRNAEKRGGLRNAVVICDEAGLKSNRQGAELLRFVQTHKMRVLLVGDVRQQSPSKLAIFCGSSKNTAESVAAGSRKFIGRFPLTIALP